ncbi:MAG: hypothetical protein ACLTYN_11850 [Dysosmobacter welbionis]
MQIYLAVTPAEAQEASRFRCSLAHVAYCIGPDSTLLRQNLLLQTRGGLLSVTDRGAPFIASPERLSAAALRECGRRATAAYCWISSSLLRRTGWPLRRRWPGACRPPRLCAGVLRRGVRRHSLICTAISGGNFVQRLQRPLPDGTGQAVWPWMSSGCGWTSPSRLKAAKAALSAAGNSRTCWTGSPPPFSSPRTCAPGISPMPGTARRISSSSTTRTPFPRSCGPAGTWASPPPS